MSTRRTYLLPDEVIAALDVAARASKLSRSAIVSAAVSNEIELLLAHLSMAGLVSDV